MSKARCDLCPHHCLLAEAAVGFCRARSNQDGKITAINYGLLTSIALDSIEKKPLYHFYPGSQILSVGSFGCNFRCPFCQNHEISMADIKEAQTRQVSPEELVRIALSLRPQGNIGIAYTYNEPLVGYEYVKDCAELAKQQGLKNVLVTNGCFCEEPLLNLLPLIDAFNIDLKAFRQEFYHKIGGDLETVKRAIQLAAAQSHVEVTMLIIPGQNDSEEEIKSLSRWLAAVSPDIPLHLTRFFPRFQMADQRPTKVASIYALADIAREFLHFVYVGNC